MDVLLDVASVEFTADGSAVLFTRPDHQGRPCQVRLPEWQYRWTCDALKSGKRGRVCAVWGVWAVWAMCAVCAAFAVCTVCVPCVLCVTR